MIKKYFVFPINNNVILGFTETREEIPKEADNPILEVEIHPAQIEWLEDAFTTFLEAQQFLTSILYPEEELDIPQEQLQLQ